MTTSHSGRDSGQEQVLGGAAVAEVNQPGGTWTRVVALAVTGALLLGLLGAGLVVTRSLVSRHFDTSGEHTVPDILGDRRSWTMAFDDDFEGDALDRSKWQGFRGTELDGLDPRQPFNLDQEAAWFSPDNTVLVDGQLQLVISREPAEVVGRTYPFSSGMIETGRRFLVEPGSYVEARIQVPRCDGCWPAFWLVPPDRWPPEIDIMEWGDTSRPERHRPHFNYITPSNERTGPLEYGPPNRDMRGGFHTFGLLWTHDGVLPILDGVPYPEVEAVDDLPEVPLTLILNLSVKKGATPEVGSRMLIDWVRVWRPLVGGSERLEPAGTTPRAAVQPDGHTTVRHRRRPDE